MTFSTAVGGGASPKRRSRVADQGNVGRVRAGDPSSHHPEVTDLSDHRFTHDDGRGHRAGMSQACRLDLWQSLTGLWHSEAQWGDFDNDGDLDVVIAGKTGAELLVTETYENQGGNLVLFPNPALVGVRNESSGNLAWGDYDGDGDLDLAIAGEADTGYIARVYRNDGLGNLTWDTAQVLTGVVNAALAWADYDNDGDLDLIVTGHDGENGLSILYVNEPHGMLTPDETTQLTGLYSGSADWADWDGDGDLDLLLTGSDGSSCQVIFCVNDPVGTLTEDGDHGIPGLCLSDAAWGDYDNDGDVDLALTGNTNYGQYNYARVYENDGAGNFTQVAEPMHIYRSSCAWGDYDNDGDLDLGLCGYSGTHLYTRVYENTGIGFVRTFTLVSVREGSVSWVDPDQDGDLDFFVIGAFWTGWYASLYENTGCNQNSPPSPPTNMGCHPSGTGFVFTWSGASDGDTPDDGLYYALRVGTSPGANDVVSGTYGTPLMGNVGQATSLWLDLPPGSYYWSVQTIDSGLMSSSWSDERTCGAYQKFAAPQTEKMPREQNR